MCLVKPLQHSEAIAFMRVIYSMLFRDGKISGWEEDVITSLITALNLSKGMEHEYKAVLYPNSDALASEFNQIKDPRSRYYLATIVWNIFKKDSWISIDQQQNVFFLALLKKINFDTKVYDQLVALTKKNGMSG